MRRGQKCKLAWPAYEVIRTVYLGIYIPNRSGGESEMYCDVGQGESVMRDPFALKFPAQSII
jgi:hypothetical protein